MCSLSPHPVLHHPPDFVRLCFAAVSEMREKAKQEASALCGDLASHNDNIAVIFFCGINTLFVFPPLSLLTPMAFFAFIDAVLPFHFGFHGV